MNVGVVGLGKLGAPTARVLSGAGHIVVGYDTLDMPRAGITHAPSLGELVGVSELVLVVVPTPHEARFDGTVPLPADRADFDYTALTSTLNSIDLIAVLGSRMVDVAVVSTVLPGTWERLYRGRWANIRYAYNPSFAAMGETVEADLRDPEFLLVGADWPAGRIVDLWQQVNGFPPVVTVDIPTAECAKVFYNTFVTAKITLGNLWGEIADRVGGDGQQVMGVLQHARRRLWSPAYMWPGMGDGGPCHPRDNIALSWLARELGVSFDLFGALMEAREAHTRWLASMIPDGAVLFGGPYKPGVELLDGSAGVLLANVLAADGKHVTLGSDPEPGVYNVIVTAEPRYGRIDWPEGSTVLDPFGMIDEQEGVTVIRPGRRA